MRDRRQNLGGVPLPWHLARLRSVYALCERHRCDDLRVAEEWGTFSEINGVLARYEGNLGWQRPRLHGVGFASGTNEIGFVRVNEDEDLLAAAVLATVTGWNGATGSVRLGKTKLAKAIKRLAPAEACREVDQSNPKIWREIHSWIWSGGYDRGGEPDRGFRRRSGVTQR
jgi:hypothetical protein